MRDLFLMLALDLSQQAETGATPRVVALQSLVAMQAKQIAKLKRTIEQQGAVIAELKAELAQPPATRTSGRQCAAAALQQTLKQVHRQRSHGATKQTI